MKKIFSTNLNKNIIIPKFDKCILVNIIILSACFKQKIRKTENKKYYKTYVIKNIYHVP